MAGLLNPSSADPVTAATDPPPGGAGVLREVAVLARLKFTVLRHASSGLRISRLVCWPLAVAASWGAVLAASDGARHDVLLLVAAVWTVGWLIGPVLASGPGVLRPEFFALLPLGRRRLSATLLAVACIGHGPAVTVLSLAALGVHAYALAPAALLVAVACLPPLLVLLVALSRACYAYLGAAMGTRLGVAMSGVQYGALIAALLVGWLALSATGEGIAGVLRDGLPGTATARVLEVLPVSWPVLAVEAAAEGRWPAALGLLLALVAAAALAALGCAALLRPRTRAAAPRRRRRPLGSRPGRRLLPATPLGAVVGRELRQWVRDPWRSLELQCAFWAVVFTAVLAQLGGLPEILPFAGLLIGVLAGMVACNLLGHDGTALWLTVVGAGPRTVRDDIRGRQVALLLLFTPLALAFAAALTLLSGQHWAWPLLLALLPALLGSGVGVAVLLSVVASAQGVDPRYRVGPNDAGDVSYQAQLALYGTQLLALPTLAPGVVLLVLALTGADGGAQPSLAPTAWLLVPLGLANGALAAWLLGRLAHRRLAARLPETFVRLRYGRALADQEAATGTGLLDRMERGALETNQPRRPVGS